MLLFPLFLVHRAEIAKLFLLFLNAKIEIAVEIVEIANFAISGAISPTSALGAVSFVVSSLDLASVTRESAGLGPYM